VRRRAEGGTVVRVHRRFDGGDLRRHRLDDQLREIAHEPLIPIFLEQEPRIKRRHAVDCTQ